MATNTKWSDEDKKNLIHIVSIHGQNGTAYKLAAEQLGRTPKACKNMFYKLKNAPCEKR